VYKPGSTLAKKKTSPSEARFMFSALRRLAERQEWAEDVDSDIP
jgi:hypothetical protein